MKQSSDGAPASLRPFQPSFLKDKKQTSKSLRASQGQRSSEMLEFEFEEMMSKLTQEGSSVGKAPRSACSSSAMGEGASEVTSKNPKVVEHNYAEGRKIEGYTEVQDRSRDQGNLAEDELVEVDGSNAGNPQKNRQKIVYNSAQLRLLCNEETAQRKLSCELPNELDPTYDPWKQPQPPFNHQQRPWWPNSSDNQDSRCDNYNDSVQTSWSEGVGGGNFSPHGGGPTGQDQFARVKSEGDWGASFVTNQNSQNHQKMPQNQFSDDGWGRQAGPSSDFNSSCQNQRGMNDSDANNPEFGFRGQSQFAPNSNTRNNSSSFGNTGGGQNKNQNQQSGNIKNSQNSNQKGFENTNNRTSSEPQVDGSWGADLVPFIQRGENNRKQSEVRARTGNQWKDNDSWREEEDSDQDEKQVEKNQLQSQQEKINGSFKQVQKVQSRVGDGSESGGWSSSDDDDDNNDEKVQSRDLVKNDDQSKFHVKPNLNSNLNPNQLLNDSNLDSNYEANLIQRDSDSGSQNIQTKQITNLNSIQNPKFDQYGNNDLRNMVDNCRKVVKEQGFTDNSNSSNNEDPWSAQFQDVPGVKPKPFVPNSSFEPERKNKVMLEEFKSRKNENQNQNRNPTNVSQFDNENYDCQNKNMFLRSNPSQPDQRFVAPVKQSKQQNSSDKNRGSSKSLFNIPEEDEDNNSEVNRGPQEERNGVNPQCQKSNFYNNQNTVPQNSRQKFTPGRQVDEKQRVFQLLVSGLDSESELDCKQNDLYPFDALDGDKKVVEKVLENLRNKALKPVSTKTTQLNSTPTAVATNQPTQYTNYDVVAKEDQILRQLEQKSRQQTQQQRDSGNFSQQPQQNSENLKNSQDTRNFQSQDVVVVNQQQNVEKTITESDQRGGGGSLETRQENQGNLKQEFQKKDAALQQGQQDVHKKEEDENIRAANYLSTEDKVGGDSIGGVSKFVSKNNVGGSGDVGQGRAAVVENDQSLLEVETKSSLETTGRTISGSSQEVVLATLKHQHGIQVTEFKEQLAGLQKQWEVQKQGMQRQLEVQQKQLELQKQNFEEHTALLQQQLNNMAEKVKTLEQALNQ